jgi:uncharacterized membrane protein
MMPAVVLAAALGCGLIAGAFFAFSTFVMRALARLAPAEGMRAMQSINVVVINGWFLGVFFGTAALCVAAAAGGGLRLAGASAYLVGTIGVTVVCHIPRNDALARVGPDAPGAAAVWERYVAGWTAWNHVRAAAALVAAALLAMAHSGS